MKKIFETDPKLKLKEEMISFHSLNPFIDTVSSSRGYMMSAHYAQSLTIKHGDEKIIQTGLEKQFGDNTFCKKAETDIRLIKSIKRYNGIDINSVTKCVETLLIVENLENNEIDFISIPYYHKLHPYFGFKYIKNEELLNKLRTNDILPKDTVFADSPSVDKNKGYKYGVNANVALINLPETTEDGIIISDRLQQKMAHDVFETRIVEFGKNSFPLNIYGDENNYKSFPEIGDLINEDSVVMVLRDYNNDLAPALISKKDVREYDPVFDKAYYVKGPGEIKNVYGEQVTYGEVVDIKVYTSQKYEKDLYTGVDNNIEKYATSLKRFYQEIIDTYEDLRLDHYKRYGNYDLPISEQMHKLIVDAYAIANPSNYKMTYSSKNEELDSVRIEFTIAYHSIVPVKASKISDSHGSKGVIVQIKPLDQMPFTYVNGEKVIADVVMDPSSVVSRMNPGRIYEQYFNAISRKTQYEIRKVMNYPNTKYTKDEITKGWNVLLGLLEIIGTEQYDGYKQVQDENIKKDILEECLTKEVFILYKISTEKRPYQVVTDVQGTIYEPEIKPVHLPQEDGSIKVTSENIIIAPIYTILLFKTGENYLSVAGSKLNHFGMPIGVTGATRNFIPWRASPTRILSETGSRLISAYTNRYVLAELKDRANSIPSHKAAYLNILEAEQPTNINKLIDRRIQPYGDDSSLELVNNIFNSAGLKIDYK